ncbi:unnamed protein product [Rotaria sp. Silwood1]|nr:unnamed protein product [Rotaria sp. Silwood1]
MNGFYASIEKMFDFGSVKTEVTVPSIPNVTWQHVWSSSETQVALLNSPFVSISNEILLHIFRFLSVRDLGNVSLVCRSFKMVADQDEIWKPKCNTSAKLYSKSFKQIYMDWMHGKCLHNKHLRRMGLSIRTACVRISPPVFPTRPTGKYNFESIGGFTQHPNSSSTMTIELSVNIEDTARELIKLLEKASKFQQQWQQSSILKQMIIRYYRFMQLKASNPSNLLLVPTLDIEIVWQTHLLRPEIYQADCIRLFRRIIDHKLLANDIEEFLKEQAFRDTCQLYEQRFGEQYCPLSSIGHLNQVPSNVFHYIFDSHINELTNYSYWDKTNFEFSLESPKDYENPFSFTEGDINLDMKWLDMCKKFMMDALQKMSDGSYYSPLSTGINLGPGAMKRLKKSYERFLYMAVKYPLKDGNGFVPPTYAIDIMWHAHMQEPLNYAADCVRLVGYVIFHDPWPIIDDSNMKKSCDKTDEIWTREFDSDITTDHLYNTME